MICRLSIRQLVLSDGVLLDEFRGEDVQVNPVSPLTFRLAGCINILRCKWTCPGTLLDIARREMWWQEIGTHHQGISQWLLNGGFKLFLCSAKHEYLAAGKRVGTSSKGMTVPIPA